MTDKIAQASGRELNEWLDELLADGDTYEPEPDPEDIGTAGVFGPHPHMQTPGGALARMEDAVNDVIGRSDAGIAITARATEVFFACTGKRVAEAPEAFRLFSEALLATVAPGREEWVRDCLSRLDSTSSDEKRVALLTLLREGALARSAWADVNALVQSNNVATGVPQPPALAKRAAVLIDGRLGALTEKQVNSAIRRHRSVYAQAGRLALECGAFDDRRGKNESENKALNRLAAAFRAAEERLDLHIKPPDV